MTAAMSKFPSPVVVVGGTRGKSVGRTVERLRARGMPVRPLSRSSSIPVDRASPITNEAFVEGVAGAPTEEARNYAALFSEVLDGRNTRVAHSVTPMLGRDPIAFADFARAAAPAVACSRQPETT